MNTIENNKMLAEFIGWGNKETTKVYFNINGTANDLNFEKDWNRLMMVVTHIERNLSDEFFVVILEEECNIYQKYKNGIKLDTPKEIVSIDCKDEKIDAVYEACFYFSKWYKNYELTKDMEVRFIEVFTEQNELHIEINYGKTENEQSSLLVDIDIDTMLVNSVIDITEHFQEDEYTETTTKTSIEFDLSLFDIVIDKCIEYSKNDLKRNWFESYPSVKL